MKLIVSILGVLMLLCGTTNADTIFSEDFENGTLDTRLSVTNKGSFVSMPAIDDNPVFGSRRAFGFGRSVVPGFASWDYVSALLLSFEQPTFVSSVSFKDIELYGDLGSEGQLFVDGQKVGDFGRTNNSRMPDLFFRTNSIEVNRTVTNVTFLVYDITEESEIFVDDIEIAGSGLAIDAQPQSQQVPFGATARFSVVATNGATNAVFTYQWYFNGFPIMGETNSQLVITDVNNFYIGTYKVAVSDGFAAVISSNALLSVSPLALTIYPAVEIEFPSEVGKKYQLQSSQDLINWKNIDGSIPGTGQLIQRLHSVRGSRELFYRLIEE